MLIRCNLSFDSRKFYKELSPTKQFLVCIAVYCAPSSLVLTKENKSISLGFQVEALVISRRNILGYLVHILRRGGQLFIQDDPLREEASGLLSEIIHFGKKLMVAYPK